VPRLAQSGRLSLTINVRLQARYLVLLPDAGFIREPDFYLAWIDAFLLGNFLQAGGKAFLKSSTAPSA
jgi:hypothetical protein